MPLPAPGPDDREFWEGCARHELLIQQCRLCGRFRFPARPMCPGCASLSAGWTKVSGSGKIYSWINVVHPVHPGLRGRVPLLVVLVELDDAPGVRLVGNMADCTAADVAIGMPVQVEFEDVAGGVSLYRFRRR